MPNASVNNSKIYSKYKLYWYIYNCMQVSVYNC